MPRFPKSALKGKGGVGHYSNNKGTYYGPDPTDTGKGGPKAAPNGGSVRPLDIPDSKVPRSKGAPVEQSGSLGIPTSKMPRQVRGRAQNEPHLR